MGQNQKQVTSQGWFARRIVRCFRPAAAILAVGTVLSWSGPADSQSIYGCRDLESAHTPSFEGRDGVFFRLDPDLAMYHRLPDEIVAQVADLASALKEKGTTLIFVPVPTKALVLTEYLGPYAAKFGYDLNVAAALYDDSVARLRSAGVEVVDARRALAENGTELPYFRTDPRLTNFGLRALARAIAESLPPPGAGAPDSAYRTYSAGSVTLASTSRSLLQFECLLPIPEVKTESFATSHVGNGASAASEADDTGVVIVGTGMTGGHELNFAGFLSEASGRSILQRSSEDDDAFAAISSYLTSDAFLSNRPDALVWEVPIWANLGLRGDQPMRELAAAARHRCGERLRVISTEDGRWRTELSTDVSPQSTILLESRDPTRRARFHFFSGDRQVRSRPVVRPEGLEPSPRVFMPLSGLWPGGAVFVEVETDPPHGTAPAVMLCEG